MSIRYWKLLILVALFLWPAAVFGQSPELMDAYNRVNELYAEGRYQEGEFERRAGIFLGPEFGTVSRPDLMEAAREAAVVGPPPPSSWRSTPPPRSPSSPSSWPSCPGRSG